MIPNVLIRATNFCTSNVLRYGILFLDKSRSCNFATTTALRRKKSKKDKKAEKDLFKIKRPDTCAEYVQPILTVLCKAAVIVGGASGSGFAAADHLLSQGARGITIADEDPIQGKLAVKKLCESYGLGRAKFLLCNPRSACQFEGVLREAVNQQNGIHVLFNDLDKDKPAVECSPCGGKENPNNTRRTIEVGMKVMSKMNGGLGGIIVNCASILGFMGWPEEPTPVYCMKEPAIETTLNLAKEYTVENTGVRLIALCPMNKEFGSIGLPDFPEDLPKDNSKRPPCIPLSTWRVGTALEHVMSWAQTGTVWVVERPTSIRELPRLIHFPQKEGDKVDPKIYEAQHCPPAIEAHCAAIPKDDCARKKINRVKCLPKKKK